MSAGGPLDLAPRGDLDHIPRQPQPAQARITRPETSNSHQRRPWNAERGNAWWLLCQASPMEGVASQNTLPEWSSVAKRRLPKKWQIEFTLNVAWWNRKTRAKPPHRAADNAPPIPPATMYPSPKGIAMPAATIGRKARSITVIPRSS